MPGPDLSAHERIALTLEHVARELRGWDASARDAAVDTLRHLAADVRALPDADALRRAAVRLIRADVAFSRGEPGTRWCDADELREAVDDLRDALPGDVVAEAMR